MRTRKLNHVVAVILTAALSVLSSCGGAEGGNQTVEFITLDRADSSGIQSAEPVNLVIRNASDWVAVWSEHKNRIIPQPPLPIIDFSRQMVIGIVRYGNNGCYSAEIKKISSGDGELVVEYVVSRPPPPDVLCAAVMVASSHLVAVPESQLPVRFVSIDPA